MKELILTDGRGVPIERPNLPLPGSSIEEKISYLRGVAAWFDRINDTAHTAFDRRFRRAIKQKPPKKKRKKK